MVLVDLFSDELQDLAHELVLVEVELAQQKHDELDEAVDVPEVDSVALPLLAINRRQGTVNARADDGAAEVREHTRLSHDDSAFKLQEQCVDLLLLGLLVLEVGCADPADEQLSETGLLVVPRMLLVQCLEHVAAEVANLRVSRARQPLNDLEHHWQVLLRQDLLLGDRGLQEALEEA